MIDCYHFYSSPSLSLLTYCPFGYCLIFRIRDGDWTGGVRRYSRVPDSVLIQAIIYVNRLWGMTDMEWTWDSVRRLLSTAIMVADKHHDDLHYRNAHYAKLFGFSLQGISFMIHDQLSMNKCFCIFNLNIDPPLSQS